MQCHLGKAEKKPCDFGRKNTAVFGDARLTVTGLSKTTTKMFFNFKKIGKLPFRYVTVNYGNVTGNYGNEISASNPTLYEYKDNFLAR